MECDVECGTCTWVPHHNRKLVRAPAPERVCVLHCCGGGVGAAWRRGGPRRPSGGRVEGAWRARALSTRGFRLLGREVVAERFDGGERDADAEDDPDQGEDAADETPAAEVLEPVLDRAKELINPPDYDLANGRRVAAGVGLADE